MAKIRIYELAKELGVDNKDIIDKAQELGMVDKKSHSNALEDDEVRRIKKFFIQDKNLENLNAKEPIVTTTTRVDKLTGKSDTIVEKRSGNIIRRRRAVESKEESVEEPVVVKSIEKRQEVILEQPIMQQQDDVVKEDAQEERVDDTLEAPKVEINQEESKVAEKEEKIILKKQEPSKDNEDIKSEVKKVKEEVIIKKSKLGPKILGKIELSQFNTATPSSSKEKSETIKSSSGSFKKAKKETGSLDTEGTSDQGKKFDKKRARKKEFSQHELVDYEGGPSRKPKGFKARNRGENTEEDNKKTEITQPKASKMVVKIDEAITVGELAKQMSVKSGEVIAKLIGLGVMATINQIIDLETATFIAEEFGFQVESVAFDEESILTSVESDPKNFKMRPPVVTVMGHVDHGKTSLLDRIRHSSVVDKEQGGITQHIGAYTVQLANGKTITFIDTPGHAAFTQMRARGAQITDIVVLVVAADDGVMPQTIEAINHAKSAGVTIIVAVNKMDKPTANPDRIKQQLADHGLQPEEWGGNTMFFPISALTGDGVESLLEGISLQSEMLELKADPTIRAKGVIIEAKQALGRGTVATVLIQEGTLRKQDIFICGAEFGRIRSMVDYQGNVMNEASPATPVEVTGFSGVPEAGDELVVVENESTARQVATNRLGKKRMREELNDRPITLEEFSKKASEETVVELNVILKADVHGSIEAVKLSLEKLSTFKVKVNVIHAAVGGVNESDVQLAMAGNAIIVGFNVRGEARALSNAESSNVEIRFYRIIYELIDDVKRAMVGLLEPDKKEEVLGSVDVRETFQVPKVGTIAGCFVKSGVVKRATQVRVLRDHVVIHEGKIGSLRRQKDDVKEVQSGYECGIGIENFNDIKIGDEFEVYQIIDIAPSLE